jgi:16S rRNA (uracil1498-N3)-methyltransferase
MRSFSCSRRDQSSGDNDREDHAIERLRRVAREAGAQCRRARLPVIDGPVPVAEIVGRAGLVLADHEGVGPDELLEPADGAWVVAVGPEGGFDESELDSFAGVPRLAIGSFVLRAETAAIASAAALAWRRRRPT